MDWKKLISEIFATGLTQAQFGERIGRSQAWVSAASSGKYEDVKWSDGQKIIALHAELITDEFPAPDEKKVA